MGKAVQDRWCNVASIEVVESAANTATFKKLETGISLFEKVAWVVHRLEYMIDLTGLFAASGDIQKCAITTTNQLTDLLQEEASVLDMLELQRVDWGTAASGAIVQDLHTKDFNSLPGGGLIVPPNPLYLGTKGVSQGVAGTVRVRMFYTVQKLEASDFWELVEARRIISS